MQQIIKIQVNIQRAKQHLNIQAKGKNKKQAMLIDQTCQYKIKLHKSLAETEDLTQEVREPLSWNVLTLLQICHVRQQLAAIRQLYRFFSNLFETQTALEIINHSLQPDFQV